MAGFFTSLFNMLALRQISPLVIREYGTHRMIVIYTLSGVFGFLVSYLAGVSLTIGASAAVCGLIGAALYYGKRRGGTYGQAVYRQVGGWALGIALFGLAMPGINNWAHGGGMAAGILLGLLMGYHERKKENLRHRLAAGLCLSGTAASLIVGGFHRPVFPAIAGSWESAVLETGGSSADYQGDGDHKARARCAVSSGAVNVAISPSITSKPVWSLLTQAA